MENTLSEFEWSRDEVMNLIELYRDKPVLWDTTLAQYKDKNLKNNAWTEIAQEMNTTKAEVQVKMKKVISQFNRESKKGRSGSGPDDSVKSKWFAYESLRFIKSRAAPRHAREIGLDNEIGTQSNNNTAANDDVEESIQTEGQSEQQKETTAQVCHKRQAIKRKVMVEEAYAEQLGNNIRVKDDLDVFGENVACHLRKMKDERNRILAKYRINQVLFEMELAEHSISSNSSRSVPSTAFNTPSRPSSAGSTSLSGAPRN